MERSPRYTLLFALAICGVCSIFVSVSFVALEERQLENKRLDVQSKVLGLAGLMDIENPLPREQISSLFESRIKARVVQLETGQYDEDIDTANFDQQVAARDPDTSRVAPPNDAKVVRIPKHGLVYQVMENGEIQSLILPVEGKGLWSTLYGFVALSADTQTIQGITFYQHGETPGLGGEVDNPRWKALWKGRKAFDDDWQPKISVKKGVAGSVEDDPYHVDGLSGATITSRGVTHLVQFWLGTHGFGPYLAQHRAAREI